MMLNPALHFTNFICKHIQNTHMHTDTFGCTKKNIFPSYNSNNLFVSKRKAKLARVVFKSKKAKGQLNT